MKNLFIILLVFIFAGCVSKQEFPSSWNKLNTTTLNDCQNISGLYLNSGKLAESKYAPFLQDIIIPEVNTKVDSIKVLKSGDNLKVEAFFNEKLVSEKNIVIDNDKVTCDKGYLIIKRNDGHNKEGVLAVEWDKYYLIKNNQGLIIKKENSALGLFFLVPILGSNTTWMMFKEINKGN